MALCMMAWATVATLTALVKDYTGLVIVRFFLGVVEAPFYPGALYILSLFYTRKEIATRVSILYAGNIFAVSFAGLIAAATFETLSGKHGLHGWQWLFIIEGVVTFGVAIGAIWLLPDMPLETKWLTPEQRQLAHDRIQRDTVGLEPSKGAMAGFMQAARDPRLYLLVFMQNMHLSATSFNQVCSNSSQGTPSEPYLICVTVLPHRRQLSRFQYDNYARPYLSALACRRCCRNRHWYLVWEIQ
jgi:MFS family permease